MLYWINLLYHTHFIVSQFYFGIRGHKIGFSCHTFGYILLCFCSWLYFIWTELCNALFGLVTIFRRGRYTHAATFEFIKSVLTHVLRASSAKRAEMYDFFCLGCQSKVCLFKCSNDFSTVCLLLSSSACHGLLLPLGWDGAAVVFVCYAFIQFICRRKHEPKLFQPMFQLPLLTSPTKCAVIVAESWLQPHSFTFAATLSLLKSLFPTYFSVAVTCYVTVSRMSQESRAAEQ